MPPKVKITKESIVSAAVELVRKSGAESLNARAIASALNCSTQPIFSNFSTMEEIRNAVIEEAENICEAYLRNELKKEIYPEYKANGMGYIRFAKEEKELFKFLYMRSRSKEAMAEDNRLFNQMEDVVHSATGLNQDGSRLFHLEMWAYVHGIACMFATGFLELEWALTEKMLTDAFLGLKKQYGTEE